MVLTEDLLAKMLGAGSRVAVTVGQQHVDVAVQLTFFEDGSEHERGHMDRDADGRVDRQEAAAYLAAKAGPLERSVRLRIAGQPVTLTTLFPAELDLLGNEQVGRGHHRLTLHFFARTPSQLTEGTELVVEDRLWPEVRALAALQVEGRDGCQIDPLPAADALLPPAPPGEAREFKARLRTPPKTPAGNPTPPAPSEARSPIHSPDPP